MNPISVTLYCGCGRTRNVVIEPKDQALDTKCVCGEDMYGRALLLKPAEKMSRKLVKKSGKKTYVVGYCNSRIEIFVTHVRVETLFVRDLLCYNPSSKSYRVA